MLRKRGTPDIIDVNVKGKFMWWEFNFPHVPRVEDAYWTMWVTYGMSGQWSQQETKHSAFGVYVNDTGDASGFDALYFNDQRHFGTIKFVQGHSALRKKLATLGPDMLNDPPDVTGFIKHMSRRSTKTLAEALMDQSVVSGVGNYVKAEALYLAELSPHRRVDSLSLFEGERLRQAIINVMKTSYDTGGATISTYRNVDGTTGTAQRRFAVYGNDVDPHGNVVVSETTPDKRTTWWCPERQK